MGLTPSARVEGLGGEAAEERGERVSSMRATSMIHYDTQQCSLRLAQTTNRPPQNRLLYYCNSIMHYSSTS